MKIGFSQFSQLGSYEVWRLTEFDWFYLERLRRSSRLAGHERLKTDLGQTAIFTWVEPNA